MNELTAETLCINVLAALIGLSYPIMLQIITSLDVKYSSVTIMRRFKKEPAFKWFTFSLILMFGLMIYMPFAPEAPADADYFINHSARIIAIACLGITFLCLILMVWVTLIYFDPIKLQQRVASVPEKLVKNQDEYEVFLDLLKFSMAVENLQLFINCNSVFGGCVGLSRKSAQDFPIDNSVTKKSIKQLSVVYPDVIYQTVTEITRLSAKLRSINPYVANPVNFITVLFGGVGVKSVISDMTFHNIWANSVLLAASGNREWILGYWAYALQSAQYTMDLRANNHSLPEVVRECYEQELHRFIEQHYMLGAYLFYKGNIKIVDELIDYRISTNGEQTFIPNTIDKIVHTIKEIHSIPNSFFYFQYNYPFFEQRDINENNFIEGWFMKYALYCLLKAYFKIHSGNATHFQGLFDLDFHDADENDKEIINRLRSVLYDNLVFFESLGFEKLNLMSVIDKQMAAASDKIQVKINEEIASQNITDTDLEVLEREVQVSLDNSLRTLPTTESFANVSRLDKIFVTSIEITKDILYLFKEQSLADLPSLVSAAFLQYVGKVYATQVSSLPNLQKYNIDSAELIDFFKLDDVKKRKKVVIGSGIYDIAVADEIDYSIGAVDSAIYIFIDDKFPALLNQCQLTLECILIKEEVYMLEFCVRFSLLVPEDVQCLKLQLINSLFDGQKSQYADLKAQINKIFPPTSSPT